MISCAKVEELLDRRSTLPSRRMAGNISAERVNGGTLLSAQSGGCQGCAASSATLRQGVERMLRAALAADRRDRRRDRP